MSEEKMEIKPTPYPYFWWDGGKIGIVSDDPGGPEAMKQFPQLEAKTLAEWKQCSAEDQVKR